MHNRVVFPRTKPQRAGVSLMEVLISTFVLSIGLLGIASLIPVGQLAVVDANKLDRGSHVGRQALRDVRVQRMIDPNNWSAMPADSDIAPRIIDPLGLSKGMPATLGGLPRIRVNNVPDAVFQSADDLIFDTPADKSQRPRVFASGTRSRGDYSWLCTVSPLACEGPRTLASPPVPAVPWAQKTQFEVSVAVICNRGYQGKDPSGVPFEQEISGKFDTGGFGGGSFAPDAGQSLTVKENSWVLAVGTNLAQARWYRVVTGAVASDRPIMLTGPDWNNATSPAARLVVIKGVVGVYSQTMEVDRDPIWSY